jgi:hypothetical protein
VTRGLQAELPVRHAAELWVDGGDQAIHRVRLPGPHRGECVRDRVPLIAHHQLTHRNLKCRNPRRSYAFTNREIVDDRSKLCKKCQGGNTAGDMERAKAHLIPEV